MTPQQFVTRWFKTQLKETAAAQSPFKMVVPWWAILK
jgi:hypothetical protein